MKAAKNLSVAFDKGVEESKSLLEQVWERSDYDYHDTVESISVEVDILVVPQLPDEPEVVLCGSEARTHHLCNRPSSVGNISKRRSGIGPIQTVLRGYRFAERTIMETIVDLK
ncbi:hypothetical protein BJ165DRAFT_1409136 [Panaeolus papilionaceus]|nr:hypothetical protein BJ165DRAFT_1409136 [Panaeolus papilionaceus]